MLIINKKTKKEISQSRLETFERYTKVIQWGRAYPVEFCSRFMGMELLDMQKFAIYNSWFADFIVWLMCRNAGKALALDTPIKTPDGFKAMIDIEPSDIVYDINNRPTRVLAVSPIFLGHRCYKLTFEDGEMITADEQHLWSVQANRFTGTHSPDRYGYCVISTAEIAEMIRGFGDFSVPVAGNSQKSKRIINIEEVESIPTKCISVDNERGLYQCGKYGTVTHNTSIMAIYTMLRSLLIPYHATYFLGNTGEQAKEVFKKIEKLAKKEIESFAGCTDVFRNELSSYGMTGDGFKHDPASFSFELFNGSTVNTLNSNIVNIKGKRANLVCFDEAGWFSDELFVQAENFVNQDENFKLGGGLDMSIEPKSFPRQLLYASSASDTSSEFYKKFKLFSQKMMIGDQRYFSCNFTVDHVMTAKYNGEEYAPLLSRDKVEKAIEENRDKAMRELYNKFSADTHDGQILTRRDLMQCTTYDPPMLENDSGHKMFMMSWDSARLCDNSVICIAQLIDDPDIGWRMKLANVVSLVDVATKNKTPKRIPEQVDDFKELLLNYNGRVKALDYENIKAVVCDSGAGGQMVGGIADYLMESWRDKNGKLHKGLIDKTHKSTETARFKYPDAVDIFRLIDPKGNRNLIFDSIERAVKLGVVEFPAEYNGKDRIYYIDDDGEEKEYPLTEAERLSLAQIELLKTEIVTMCKYESQGNVTYNYPPDKRRTMHDDRVFAFGLLCFYLMRLRRGDVYSRKTESNLMNFTALYRRPTLLPKAQNL